MVTLGIDLSSQATNTAACKIIWKPNRKVQIDHPNVGCSDEQLHGLIEEADVVAIDAPFGWPLTFTKAVKTWTHTSWTNDPELQSSLRLRQTDKQVRDRLRGTAWPKTPLSVSSDRIALPAMRAMTILAKYGVMDKSGNQASENKKHFVEVYPAGSLAIWGIDPRGYKQGGRTTPQIALNRRIEIVNKLKNLTGITEIDETYWSSDHILDSLLASLSGRSAAVSKPLGLDKKQKRGAMQEGWIHLPSIPLEDLKKSRQDFDA